MYTDDSLHFQAKICFITPRAICFDDLAICDRYSIQSIVGVESDIISASRGDSRLNFAALLCDEKQEFSDWTGEQYEARYVK